MTLRNRIMNGFTLLVLVAGVLSILETLGGNCVLAAKLIILAAILDGFDGSVARWLKSTTEFGARLDTYVDTVSFGVAPAVLVYQLMCRFWGPWGLLICMFIVISAVLRFTRGCELEGESSQHAFRGLPIPVSAAWLAVFALMTETDALGAGRFLMQRGIVFVLMWVCALVFVALQLSNVTYTKPNKNMLFTDLALTMLAMLALRRPELVLCLSMAITLLLYVLVVPFLDNKGLLVEDLGAEAPERSPLSHGH